MLKRKYSRGEWLLFVGFVVLLGTSSYLFLTSSPSFETYGIILALFSGLLVSGILAYLWWPRGSKGALLLKIPANPTFIKLAIVFCGLFAFGFVLNMPVMFNGNDRYFLSHLSTMINIFLMFSGWLSIFLRRTQLRENGINGSLGFTPWKDIESYSWDTQGQPILLVKIKGRKVLKSISYVVPVANREAVNQILADRVLSWQEQPTKLERQS